MATQRPEPPSEACKRRTAKPAASAVRPLPARPRKRERECRRRSRAKTGPPSATPAAVQMTGAEMVVRALATRASSTCSAIRAARCCRSTTRSSTRSKVRHILVRHEQGATHAAEGYARSTGKVGCVLVTSGPGATNAVTGLTDALMDSIPLVCITGQVPTHLIGTDAFQECDTVGITRPCTKHNYLVKDVADLPRILHEAFYIATTGRPGPVVIDIPKDVQFAIGAYCRPERVPAQDYRPAARGRPGQDRGGGRADRQGASAPLFYTGGGVINSGPRRRGAAARVRASSPASRSPRR